MVCICELDFAVISNSAGVQNYTRMNKNRMQLVAMLFVFKSSQSSMWNMLLLGVIKDLPLTRKSLLMASKIIEKKFLNIRLKRKSTLKQIYPTEKKLGRETDFCPLLVNRCY